MMLPAQDGAGQFNPVLLCIGRRDWTSAINAEGVERLARRDGRRLVGHEGEMQDSLRAFDWRGRPDVNFGKHAGTQRMFRESRHFGTLIFRHNLDSLVVA